MALASLLQAALWPWWIRILVETVLGFPVGEKVAELGYFQEFLVVDCGGGFLDDTG